MVKSKHFILLFIPAIFFIGIGLSIRIKQYAPSGTAQLATNSTEGTELVRVYTEDPISGNKRLPIAIVAFVDVGCIPCKTQSDTLEELAKKHAKKVKVVWKLLPVTTVPHSTARANAYAFCAHEQKLFAAFKSVAFANGSNLSDKNLERLAQETELNPKKLTSCLASDRPALYQQKNKQLAESLHIQAVPTIFLNNKQIQPPASIAEWEKILGL